MRPPLLTTRSGSETAGRDKFLGWSAAGLFRPEVRLRVGAEATAIPLSRGDRADREARPAPFPYCLG